MKTIRRVTVNKDGRPRWKESTRDGVHRVSIRHCACDDGTRGAERSTTSREGRDFGVNI